MATICFDGVWPASASACVTGAIDPRSASERRGPAAGPGSSVPVSEPPLDEADAGPTVPASPPQATVKRSGTTRTLEMREKKERPVMGFLRTHALVEAPIAHYETLDPFPQKVD